MSNFDRSLGLRSVIVISLSAMLGSGLFVLPGLVVTLTGPSIWVAYLLAALCVLPAALSKSELATAMPSSGGTYIYIERTFGPLVGTITGIGLWLSLLLKSTFALIGLGAYMAVFTDVSIEYVALGIALFICVFNILGVSKVSKMLSYILATTALVIGGVIVMSVPQLNYSRFTYIFSNGATGLLEAAALVFVAFAGVTKVAAIAEEVKDPEKNLPRGILISLLIAVVLYCLVSYVLVAVLPLKTLAYNYKPIHTLAEFVGGKYVGFAAAIVGIATMASMANAGLLAASRFPFAMARDRLLPSMLGKIAPKYLTPVWSIILSAIIMVVAILTLPIESIAKLASSFMILIYALENVAVMVLRETRVQWYKPTYKAKFYPWIQVASVVASFVLLTAMGSVVVTGILGISIPGVLIYFFYSRNRVDRKGVVGIRGLRTDLKEIKHVTSRRRARRDVDFSKGANVVVAFTGKPKSPDMLVEICTVFADEGNLEVVHLTEVPEQTDLGDISDTAPEVLSMRRRISAISERMGTPIMFDDLVTHDMIRSIHLISRGLHCGWLATEWQGKSSGALTVNSPFDWLGEHLHCHLIKFRDTGVRYVKKVAAVIHEDIADSVVVDMADHFADVFGASLTLLLYYPPSKGVTDEQAKRKCSKVAEAYASLRTKKINVELLIGQNEPDVLVDASVHYDLMVLAIEKKTRMQIFGDNKDKFISKAGCSVVAVQPRLNE